MTGGLQGTLRGQLLTRLWAPLLLILLIGAGLSLAAARHFAAQVYDQWLYDSAMALALQVKEGPDGPAIALPPSAQQILEWDRVDQVLYEVVVNGRHIYGNAELPRPPLAQQEVYFDGQWHEEPIRMIAITVPVGADTVIVTVGETTNKRAAIVRNILLAVLPFEGVLLVLAGLLIWVAVTSALQQVNSLAGAFTRVDPDTLQPLTGIESLPAEISPLVSALNDLIVRLADARDTARRFLANAAHQLRTPLAAMQIQTQRALRETDPDRHHEALMAVEKAVLRLTHLTQQLLALARAEPGSNAPVQKQRVDLAELARAQLEQWADAAIARGTDLGYAGPSAGPYVMGEPQLLTDLVDNLIDNAIRYAGDNAHITLRLEESPITLVVEDDGPGIRPEERTRVLERFYRSPAASGSGSGLGLAIASEIVRRHDASLEITGGPNGRGTSVIATFGPGAAADRPDSTRPDAAQRAA